MTLYFLLGIFALLCCLPLLSLWRILDRFTMKMSRGFQYVVNGAFTISALACLAIVLVQLTSLVGRNIFGVSFIWLQESAIYFFALSFLLAGGAVLLANAHVRVDVFYARWSPKTQALIDLVGLYLFVFPVCGLIITAAAPYVLQSWSTLERSSEPSGIHAVYLLKTMIPTFGVLLALAGFVRATQMVALLKKERGI
ncbi:MAG: TRAP transporter small permease subunit [Pseudomonadota bacterium]